MEEHVALTRSLDVKSEVQLPTTKYSKQLNDQLRLQLQLYISIIIAVFHKLQITTNLLPGTVAHFKGKIGAPKMFAHGVGLKF